MLLLQARQQVMQQIADDKAARQARSKKTPTTEEATTPVAKLEKPEQKTPAVGPSAAAREEERERKSDQKQICRVQVHYQ